MEKLQFSYSNKNIPVPSERSYNLQLMAKIELVIKRMRWKAFFFLKNNSDIANEEPSPENFGLKSLKCPPQIKELIPFEEELLDIFKRIKFRKEKDEFQKQLTEDIKEINNTKTTLTFADKTSNIYKVSKEQYKKLINDSITSSYKKVSNNIYDKINTQGKKIINGKEVVNRMFINGKNNCFISLKDHKPNFQNHPKVRLLNPAKNELGRISKVILDKINSQLRNDLKLNQWKNTDNVIDWFKKIPNKHAHKFMIFDIKDFYPSISKKLLTNALIFAETKIEISEEDKKIIYHARKTLLFNEGEAWMKKGTDIFDVSMGAFDGAEVCELIGIFLLHIISEKHNKKNVGIYRDDGLAVFEHISGPQAEKIKKSFQKIFKDNGLDIIIECNLKIVNYLDITFNLNDGSFRPYHKPDENVKYIHVNSNHPPNIIKQLPKNIETRLSKLSSNEKIFYESAKYYEEKLKNSGYKTKLTYSPPQITNNNKNKRKRNIIWFNPPFNKNVSTKIGKLFLNLIDKHFPKNHKMFKLFNRNTVKVSYSCMKNVKAIINIHNKNILNETQTQNENKCNCRQKDNCPLDGNCLTTNVIYESIINCNEPNYKEKIYFGTATIFKQRFSNHQKSFKNKIYIKETELSKEYWKIREKGFTPKVKWKIRRKVCPYNPQSLQCQLCLNEKLEIAMYKGDNLLNKRSELISKCRHLNKFTLQRHDSKD